MNKAPMAALAFALLLPAPLFAADDLPPASPESIKAFIADLRKEAAREKISLEVFDAALKDFSPDPKVLQAMAQQPEHTKTAYAYLQQFLEPKKIQAAEEALITHRTLLGDIEARFGVSRTMLVAIWGVESRYGKILGRYDVAHALGTMLYAQRREKFARQQLFALLRLVEAGDLSLPVKGSWASAMGPMQFIPTTYESFAVDYDNDGRRNLFERGDALASAAHYLARSGWQDWRRWGVEVVLPQGFDYAQASFDNRRSFDQWGKKGIRTLSARPPSGEEQASLFLPAGHRGPAFLVTANFAALMEYNNSPLYALTVSQIAAHLAGHPPIAVPWPSRQPTTLSVAERKEIQLRLARAGFDPGPADGIIGPKTRAALSAWQAAQNLPADGFVSPFVLRFLRATLPPPQKGEN